MGLQKRKWSYLNQLLRGHDFLAVQETHSTAGTVGSVKLLSDDGVDSVRLPEGTAAAWSHGSRHQGGVGLIFKNDFLAEFYLVKKLD